MVPSLSKLELIAHAKNFWRLYRNFDPDDVNFSEMRKLFNKMMEAGKKKKEAASISVIETVAKNENEPKFYSPKIFVVVIGYVRGTLLKKSRLM